MRIFLSYASDDRDLVEPIAIRLRQENHDVFFDEASLAPGEGYDRNLREEVRSAALLVFFITPASVEPGRYTLTELKFAEQRWANPNNRILPVLLRETPTEDIPAILAALQQLQPEGNVSAEVVAAVEAIAALRRRRLQRAAGAVAMAAGLSGLAWFGLPDRGVDPRPIDPPDTVQQASTLGGGAERLVPSHYLELFEQCADFRVAGIILDDAIAFADGGLESLDATTAGDTLLVVHSVSAAEDVRQVVANIRHAFSEVSSAESADHTADEIDERAQDEDDRIQLDVLVNLGDRYMEGSSRIEYGEDLRVSMDFEVVGAQWEDTRRRHKAVFNHALARMETDPERKKRLLDEAMGLARDVCNARVRAPVRADGQ